MPHAPTPRATIKALLRGEAPAHPLLMPIIFALGSRLESVALREFQSNPTKIANALRQIRHTLKVDGLACYFDPFLEAEALGCKLNWLPDGSPCLAPAQVSDVDDFREKLLSADSLSNIGRVRIVCEVLTRLKTMLKDEPALMVRVTGPFTLAAQLTGLAGQELAAAQSSLEFCAEVAAMMAKEFATAGADVVLLVEDALPSLSTEICERWCSVLEPAINMIRFYDALPVLHLGHAARIAEASSCILDCEWNCALNLELPEAATESRKSKWVGGALPQDVFLDTRAELSTSVTSICRRLLVQRPVLLTSVDDISLTADIKRVAAVLEAARSVCQVESKTEGSPEPQRA